MRGTPPTYHRRPMHVNLGVVTSRNGSKSTTEAKEKKKVSSPNTGVVCKSNNEILRNTYTQSNTKAKTHTCYGASFVTARATTIDTHQASQSKPSSWLVLSWNFPRKYALNSSESTVLRLAADGRTTGGIGVHFLSRIRLFPQP